MAVFAVELANEFDGGFCGFGTARGEVNAAAFLEIWRSEREQTGRKFFARRRMELRGMGERQLRGLLAHGVADFGNAVANIDDGGLACGVEKFAAIGGKNPGAFAADGDGNRFVEVARKESGV